MIEANIDIQASIEKDIENDFDSDKLILELQNKNLLTENMALVLKKFYSIYTKSENILNVEDISKFYATTINDSKLSKIEKESLILAFSVAMESPEYWGNQN